MSEQRFDIIVQDKVARTIRSSLDEIGVSATGAYASLSKLNREMGASTASAASAAQKAATNTAAATAQMSAQTAKAAIQATQLDAAQTKAAVSAEKLAEAQAKTALAQQRVATETARTAEAQSKANIAYLAEEGALNKAVAAEQRAITSKNELAAAATRTAQAQQGAAKIYSYPIGPLHIADSSTSGQYPTRAPGYVPGANSASQDAGISSGLVAGAATAKAATTEVVRDVENMEKQTTPLFARFKASAQNAFDGVRDFASGNGTRFRGQANEVAAGAESAGSKLSNMGSKAGMTALSIRELLVVAREGGRGDFTRMAGSLSILAMSLDVLPAALTIAALGFGGLYAANKSANTEAEKDSLKKYAGTLGLTTKEMRKLSDTTLDAKGHLKELNIEQITYADTFNGLVKTFEDGFARMKLAGSDSASGWSTAFKIAGTVILDVYNSVAAVIIATGELVRDEAKASLEAYTHPIDAMKDGLKAVVSFVPNVVKSYKEISTAEGNFSKQLNANQDKAARDRLKADADAIKNNRNPKKGPKGFDRDQNLQNDNGELDAQIANLGKYGQALEEANKLDEISKKYRDHNVPLTAQETAAFAAKIKTLDDGKRVQEAMTSAEEAANGPARKYADTQDALDKLLASKAISQDQYTEQLNMATRAYEDAIDPLAALNRELQKNQAIIGQYGDAKDVASYIQQLAQAAESKGQSIYQKDPVAANDDGSIVAQARTRRLTPQAQGMVDQFKQQQVEGKDTQAFQAIDRDKNSAQNDPTNSAYILKNYKRLYEEIDKMRGKDTASDAAANKKKRDLDKAVLDARLQQASDMFGNLASLSSSKNKELAAIGKAAAIAQATVDGYLAVTKAYVEVPYPFNIAAAVAVGIATAANVAKIAGVGFESGGYTGNGGTSTPAGTVHGQEYVFDAPAVRRLGVPALDAMRRGSTLSQPGAGGTGGGSKVSVYPQPGVYMEEVSTSDDHIEMVAARIVSRDSPKAVAQDIHRSPNGKVGTALRSNYSLVRNR